HTHKHISKHTHTPTNTQTLKQTHTHTYTHTHAHTHTHTRTHTHAHAHLTAPAVTPDLLLRVGKELCEMSPSNQLGQAAAHRLSPGKSSKPRADNELPLRKHTHKQIALVTWHLRAGAGQLAVIRGACPY